MMHQSGYAPEIVVAQGSGIQHSRGVWNQYQLFPQLERLLAVEPDGQDLLWAMTKFPHGSEVPLHNNGDTQQYIFVLDGPITLMLVGREVDLQPGTCLVLQRQTDHGWRTAESTTAILVIVSMPMTTIA
jgi:quercetin dioxygenase-like cupin family protein